MHQGATTTTNNRKHAKPISCRLTPSTQKMYEEFCTDQRRKPSEAVEFLVEVALAVWQQGKLDDFRLQTPPKS